MRTMFLTAALVLAGSVGTANAADKTPIATNAGPAQSCVQITGIRETRVRDDSTIDFVMNSGKVYRNTLPSACPQLGFERAFSYETSLSQLCSVDIITVLHQGGGLMRGASCGLGAFQPVTLAK